jgi:hypothetical protein
MAKGRTLWEMLKAKLQGPVESQHYNPLRARIGGSVSINELDLRDLNFFIKEIREYRRRIEGREFVFTDYVLLARPLQGDDVWLRLRLNPVAEPDRGSGLTHDVLALQLDDEMGYSEEFHNVVNDTTKKFEVRQDGNLVAEYWRINDVASAYHATVAVIKDTNNDGRVDEDEVATVKVDYWDYWRETPDEAGQKFTEFLFVEMDKDSGWFQIWKGHAIDPQQVTLI